MAVDAFGLCLHERHRTSVHRLQKRNLDGQLLHTLLSAERSGAGLDGGAKSLDCRGDLDIGRYRGTVAFVNLSSCQPSRLSNGAQCQLSNNFLRHLGGMNGRRPKAIRDISVLPIFIWERI